MAGFLVRVAMLIAIAALCVSGSRAHEWYPAECCSGNDCAPISAQAVSETPDGYVVTIEPGSHPMWPQDGRAALVHVIAYKAARRSQDGRFHICIGASGYLFCFYAAVGGV
ncbi:hypothetical protein [Terrarubrum flagellatum]|uniref:hypothetical protein n=1 Tax=Terrirubrum flagellatum TaxID=2895980 RepID=UPI0031456FDF